MNGELILRPARPDDRPAMERVCAQTFDWGDYIPRVWDDWLADEQSLVLVGEQGDSVVALSKITFQAPDQVWLGGMRVHPDHRRRGIAGRFLDHSLDYARQRGARVVRLGTSQRNAPVQRMMARAGMTRVGSYVLWTAEPQPGGVSLSFLSPQHSAQARAFLADSPVLAHTHGLYSFHWEWQELSAEHVARSLQDGQMAARFAADGSLAALALTRFDPDDETLWIGFVDGQPEAVTTLAVAIRSRAAQLAAQKVQIMLPDLLWLRDTFRTAGYGFGDWQGELWIFERWLIDRPQGRSGEDFTARQPVTASPSFDGEVRGDGHDG
jgi:GNAT superfamily N-acetyltransferase